VKNDNSLCSFTASQTGLNTTVKQLHIVNILILCTSTEHVFNVSAVLSHYELHTTRPFTNALTTTEFWFWWK